MPLCHHGRYFRTYDNLPYVYDVSANFLIKWVIALVLSKIIHLLPKFLSKPLHLNIFKLGSGSIEHWRCWSPWTYFQRSQVCKLTLCKMVLYNNHHLHWSSCFNYIRPISSWPCIRVWKKIEFGKKPVWF